MRLSRLFVSQSKLDQWLGEGLVDVTGEVMTTTEGTFELETAVLFVREVTGAGDPHDLLGKVKDLEQIAALGGEYASGSVLVGDHAYDVIEGFVGEPLPARAEASQLRGDTLAAAMARATGANADSARDGELELLARFFLSRQP